MYRKLGRDSSARKALFRSMLTSFFQYERIETTEAKAKELRSLADQMVLWLNVVIFMHVAKFLHTSWMKA